MMRPVNVVSGLLIETHCLTAGLLSDVETYGRSLVARSETGHNITRNIEPPDEWPWFAEPGCRRHKKLELDAAHKVDAGFGTDHQTQVSNAAHTACLNGNPCHPRRLLAE